jgi:hypothetical protein
LLEATSSTAEGEHKQESSKEDPSTPRPKGLMLALFVSLFIETMAIAMSSQLSSQGQKSIPSFHLVGVIAAIVEVIVIGAFFVVLDIYFRFVHAGVKDKAFFGIFFTAGIFLGLAMEAFSLIIAGGVKNNSWYPPFAGCLAGIYIYIFAGFLLAFLIGYYFFNSFLGGDEWSSRFQELLGCYGTGLILGNAIALLLAFANVGVQEGARPKLLSVMLCFCLSVTVAYFLASMIALAQKEVKDDDKEDEVTHPTSA